MFDIYFGTESLCTKLSLTFLYDEFGIDYIRLITSPVERFEIIGILFLIDPVEGVLVDEFACGFMG